ncbi:DUF4468 domain-containing protein [Spirosoma oryzicola]|uniref:DUF4468 domain-containing protein n=1 Tax=Spirosoma oryzicola TaxID=2898794 RepID=UPI001E28CF5A|nr:DUF4468 domain-containing protein [Spirosoma oryzicola]UHG93222.1 DUF4468 domain-containing protein [Spirosoma oryzicola]
MKKLFTVLLLFVTASAFCQEKYKGVLPLEGDKVVYTEDVKVPDMSKAEIFRRARRWFVLMYKSPDQVLKLNDEATGELIARGFGEAVTPDKKKIDQLRVLLHTETQFDAKESGYHIKVGNLYVQRSLSDPNKPIQEFKRFPEKNLIRTLEACDQKVKANMASLNKYILTEQFDQ